MVIAGGSPGFEMSGHKVAILLGTSGALQAIWFLSKWKNASIAPNPAVTEPLGRPNVRERSSVFPGADLRSIQAAVGRTCRVETRGKSSSKLLDMCEHMFYSFLMTTIAAHQIEALALLCVPRGSSAEWDPASARVGLQHLRRLQGEVDGLRAVLVGVLKTETGRDTKATLVRGFGMSSAEATKAEQVADIVGRVPGAGEALANGSVTGEHLRRLTPITEPTEADELLALAESQSPDEFAKTVDQYRIDRNAKGWRDRQRRARSVRFFKADHGCVGIRVILPTVEGEQVRGALDQACDAAWRAAHPERSETIGGHDDEPRECRLADALVDLVTGTSSGGSSRTALIVTVQAETLEAKVLGTGPITAADALALVDDPRTDVYAAVQAADGGILKFGRSRRLASPLQKLALALRDGGICAHPGCTTRWDRCDADHDPPWDEGGLTDVEAMRHLCTCEHHPHRHETGRNITRQRDGTWTVDNETLLPWRARTADSPTTGSSRSDVERRRCLRMLHRSVGRPDPEPEECLTT